MLNTALYLLSLALLFIWIRARSRTSVRQLFAFWWVGLLIARIGPLLMNALLVKILGNESHFAGQLVAATYWVGAMLLLRAILGLSWWKRTLRRRTKFALGLLVLALLLSTGSAASRFAVVGLLSIPWLTRTKWREEMGASGLLFASFTGFASFLLSVVNWNESKGLNTIPTEGAFLRLEAASVGVAAVYGVITLFAASTRIHLSIRRVGRRLVTSHLLAGFVPMVVSVLFLLLAGSLYLSSYRGQLGNRYLSALSADAGLRMSASLARTGEPPSRPFAVKSARQVIIVMEEGKPIETRGGPLDFPPEALLRRTERSPDVPLLWDRHTLYLRARVDTLRNGRAIRYEALAPIDSVDVLRIAAVVGTPVQIAPGMMVSRRSGGIQIGTEDDAEADSLTAAVARLDSLASAHASAGVSGAQRLDSRGERQRLEEMAQRLEDRADSLEDVPGVSAEEIKALIADSESLGTAADNLKGKERPSSQLLGTPVTGAWKLPGGAVVSCFRLRGGEFVAGEVPILANAGVAEIVSALVSVARTNPIATVALIILAFLAVLLIGATAVTVTMVSGMVRSVTRAVQVLKEATTAIGEGKLEHRIKVEGQDELWSVASSFNEMASGLERVRAMELQNQRLEQELSLAREIQNRLLPSSSPNVPEFEIAGVSMPAREVGGDYFDYLILEGGLIGIAVADVSGKGAAAALLMSSFRASLRSYDLAGLGPAETLSRLNRFVHGSVSPGKFITAFLGVLDPRTGDLRYSCAGHEPPIVISPDGSAEMLSAGGLVLGLFPNAVYEEATSRLPKGSLLAVFTDGVTEAQSPEGEFYGDTRLMAALKLDHDVSPQPLLDKFVKSLKDFAGGAAQFDDITMVLARRL